MTSGLVVMACMLVLGSWKLHENQVARTGVLTAVLFIASLIHPPIPGTKVHLLLNGVAGILLGRHVGLAIPVALFLQAILLNHGGLYSVGINSATMGIPALVASELFIMLRKLVGFDTTWKRLAMGATVAGSSVLGTLVLYYLVLRFGAVEQEDLSTLADLAFVLHIPVLIIEMVITAFLVDFVYKIKPELLGVSKNRPSL
jgi:cobalt/nickel transport system permease protein